MIFVTVGSRGYAFNRLFEKLDELYDAKILTEPTVAQIGSSTYVPRNYRYVDFLSPQEFDEHVAQADIVVSHGASGSIMKALHAHKKVIGVSRLRKYMEHINDHQVQCNEAFASGHYIVMADPELTNLGECFRKIYANEVELVPWVNKNPMAIVNLVDDFIQENWYR